MTRWHRAWYALLAGVAALLFGALFYRQQLQIDALNRRVALLRAVSPGRTEREVTLWLGPPDRAETLTIGGVRYPRVLEYRSDPGRLQGTEDLWIALDSRGQVAAVFYPDTPQDRRIVESRSVPGE